MMYPSPHRGCVCLLVVLSAITSGATLPAGESAPGTGIYEPERESDPYLPGEGQLRGGARLHSLAPAGSVQVNVGAGGLNIVGDAANEPSIVIDPTNPQRMAIGWRQFDNIASNFRQAGYAYTTDGGATWTFPGVIDPGVFRSDPVLAANSGGTFFYNSLLGSNFCVDVWESADGGATWPSLAFGFGGDKQWMDIDRTGGMGEGHLYCAWQFAATCDGTGNLFSRSTDNNGSWMTPIAIPTSPRFGITHVASNGQVFVTGTSTSPASFSTYVVARSSNAQNSAVTPTWDFVVSGAFLAGAQTLNQPPNPAGLMGQVHIASDPQNASRVYLLCSVNPAGNDPLDVRFARSVDGGQTWAASVRINDDSLTNNAYQWFGTMSVAPTGRIDVIWNDTRDDAANQLSRVYYSFSVDGGVTWSANRPLTPQWNSLLGFPNQNKIGDYYHMISDNLAAHLAYSATFNGEQDVYYMRITPLPTCGTCAGDVNGDNLTDGLDVAGFVDCFLRFPRNAPACGCADMNADQLVDEADVSPFVARLLAGGCS